MKAIIYSQSGDPDVLRLVERPTPEPGPGEVRVRVKVSGVNPTDWKARRGAGPGQPLAYPEVVPNQDGAGVVDAVGPGVERLGVGQRVWLWEAAWERADGTAQEYVVVPERQAVALPEGASFDLGASLGIPALTAHRCLTASAAGPSRLAPGALTGRTVLVAGGAGAVGHAAIELARWAGAEVVTTVSSPEKAALARAAGAYHVVDYRAEDAAEAIRKVAPGGVDIVVEAGAVGKVLIDVG
jgi:NADPH:quinone reductase